MAAYCVFDIHEIESQEAKHAYRHQVMEVVSKFGGSYILIGSGTNKKGNGQPLLPVMIEFPSMKNAEEWFISEDYNLMKALRPSEVSSHAVFFEGYASDEVLNENYLQEV